MSKLRNVVPVEARIYDNPKDPENSDYDVRVYVTATDYIYDSKTGHKLTETISDMQNQISILTQEPAALAASFLGISFLE